MLQTISFIAEFLNYITFKVLSDVLEKLGLISTSNKFNVSFYEKLAERPALAVMENNEIISADFTDGESCELSGVCDILKRTFKKIYYFDNLTLDFNEDSEKINFWLFPASVYYGMSYTSIILYTFLLIALIGYFRNPIKNSLIIMRNLINDLMNSFKRRIN